MKVWHSDLKVLWGKHYLGLKTGKIKIKKKRQDNLMNNDVRILNKTQAIKAIPQEIN